MYAGRTTIFQNFFFIFKQAKFFKDRIIVYTPDYAASCTRRQTSSTLFIMQIGNNSQNSGDASVRIDLETKKNTRFSKKCLYSSVFNHELLNHYTMRCIGKYLLFIKAEIETLFLYARIHKNAHLKEAVVVLVGFPVVDIHGVAGRRGYAGRLGVVARDSRRRWPSWCRRWPSRLCWPSWRRSSRRSRRCRRRYRRRWRAWQVSLVGGL